MRRSCQNPNPTTTQPNLTQVWVLHEYDFTPPTTTTINSTPAISQLLLTRFGPNFKCRFLVPSSTDANCHGDICPSNIYPDNICPGDICPYRNISAVFDPILIKLFWSEFLGTLIFLTKILFGPKFCLTQIYLDPTFFWTKKFVRQFFLLNYFFNKFFWPRFFYLEFIWHEKFVLN